MTDKSKVEKLAEMLYDEKSRNGWINVSFDNRLKEATTYYRIKEIIKKNKNK